VAWYLLRRVLAAVPVVIGLSIAAFLIIHLVPGNPVQQMLGAHATPETVAAVSHELGLDRPLPEQYLKFVSGAVVGDFGTSITLNQPVTTLIRQRSVATFWLLLYGVFVALLIGVPLAIWSAVRRDKSADQIIRLFSTTAFGMPTFWLGLVLALIFGLELGWLPVGGYTDAFPALLKSLTLPAITLGLSLTAIVIRSLRSSLLESLSSEYVEAARARGLAERRVVLRYGVRNSLGAMVTIVAVNIGYLIGGTVVIETVYQIPGLGSLLVDASLRRDYTLVTALALVAGVAVVVISLVTDLLYAYLDPRVRLES
jgi:ABC-type dipeptide/oligopeptide/nickel transport system permease component